MRAAIASSLDKDRQWRRYDTVSGSIFLLIGGHPGSILARSPARGGGSVTRRGERNDQKQSERAQKVVGKVHQGAGVHAARGWSRGRSGDRQRGRGDAGSIHL